VQQVQRLAAVVDPETVRAAEVEQNIVRCPIQPSPNA